MTTIIPLPQLNELHDLPQNGPNAFPLDYVGIDDDTYLGGDRMLGELGWMRCGII